MKTSLKVMIIITVIILGIGIICGAGIASDLNAEISQTENIVIDGADFTWIVQTFGYLASAMAVVISIGFGVAISAVIWTVYGIVMLIIWLVNKSKKTETTGATEYYENEYRG